MRNEQIGESRVRRAVATVAGGAEGMVWHTRRPQHTLTPAALPKGLIPARINATRLVESEDASRNGTVTVCERRGTLYLAS